MDQPSHSNAALGDESGSEPSLSFGKRRTRRSAPPPTIEEEIGLEAATQRALRASLLDGADDERPVTGPQRPAIRTAKATNAKKRSVAGNEDDNDEPAPKKAANKKQAKQASKAKKVAPKAAVAKKQNRKQDQPAPMNPDAEFRRAFEAKEASSSGVLQLSAEDCAPNDRAYKTRPVHPKVLAAEKKGTSTQGFTAYYRDMPANINVPTAGIPSDKPHRPKQRMEALLAAVNGAMEDDTIMDGNHTHSDSAGLALDNVGDNGGADNNAADNGAAMVEMISGVHSPHRDESVQCVAASADNAMGTQALDSPDNVLTLADTALHYRAPGIDYRASDSPFNLRAPVSRNLNQRFAAQPATPAMGSHSILSMTLVHPVHDMREIWALTPYLSFGFPSRIDPMTNLHTFLQEDAFHQRPSIKIVLPDVIKGLLVDDWESVTKNCQLVPIPHPKPVTVVLDNYLEYEKAQRQEGSSSIDILEETIAGLKEYFDKCLGRILLYRFERAQYAEVREKWVTEGSELYGKAPSDTYGSEHLMRLFTSLPELVAQTNMDQQSVNRLREELAKFTQWLTRNAQDYFLNEYEVPSAEYSEKAKN
ncbi:Esa1p-associated factor [Neopestalotiopsis sp. 37M]|nr:Esa1p-associated factor [Neopestalotiopsis sp. 37M]